MLYSVGLSAGATGRTLSVIIFVVDFLEPSFLRLWILDTADEFAAVEAAMTDTDFLSIEYLKFVISAILERWLTFC